MPRQADMAKDSEVLSHVDQVKLACRTYHEILADLKRALHRFNMKLLVHLLCPFLDDIYFSVSVAKNKILLFRVVWH